jgi:hypothetical protein
MTQLAVREFGREIHQADLVTISDDARSLDGRTKLSDVARKVVGQ